MAIRSLLQKNGLPSKTRVLRDYGYLEDKADQTKFLLELQTMVEQSRKENQPFELFIDTNRKINDPANRDMNYGVLILRKLYEQLHIPEFIKAHRNSRAKYDLNEILCYLTCMKIIFPDSKRATYMNSKHIYGMDISFNLQDVYAALTEICALRFQLQRHLQRELSRLLKADKSYVYLDVTNTYMEVDFAREGALGQRGVSKDHRTEPIVQMGLLLDSNGYVFSQILKGKKGSRARKALTNKAYTIDHSKYKYVKAEKVDQETGEVLENINDMLSIDEAKIEEDAKFDGYFCLVTSEMDYDERRIREVYHNLWLIENTFRLEKTDQNMHAIFVWTDDHIRAHFMIGHLAALITRLIQRSMKEESLSAERIQKLSRALNFSLSKAYMRQEKINNALSKVALSLQ